MLAGWCPTLLIGGGGVGGVDESGVGGWPAQEGWLVSL